MGKKKPIVTPFGQWAYPGEITVIPSNTITMKGVDYPVMGIDNLGNSELMLPGGEYTFPGDYVTEIPQMGKGGLTQWFAEEWTDVKTGKPCGRSGKEKGSRPYPACRPKKRVNETTPKTTSEMSSAEKARFKREKTSGKRIDYNHKRREFGGETWLDQYQDAGEVLPKSIGTYTNQFNEEISGVKDWYEANRKRIGETVPEAYLTYNQKSYPKPYGPESNPMEYNFLASKDYYNNKLIPGVKTLYDPITDTLSEQYVPPVFPFNFPKLDFTFNDNESPSALEQGIANRFVYNLPPDYDRFATVKNYDANPPFVADWKNKQNINISNEPIDVDRFTAKNDPSTILSHETSHYLNKNNPEVFLFNRTKLAEMGITDTEGFKNYYGDGVVATPSNTIDGATKIYSGYNNDRKEDELLSDAYALKQDMRKKGFYDYTKGEKLTPEIWNKYKKEYGDGFIINRFTPVFEDQGQNNIEKLYNNHFPPLILNDSYNITDPFSPYLKNTKETPTFKTSDERIIHLLNQIVKNKDQGLNVAKYGGWLDSYQDAGEVSTEQNPESIGQVRVKAKDKGWFDNYIIRPLRKWGRAYAKRMSDATGGSEWYKQPNSVLRGIWSAGPGFVFEAPQLTATYAVTGKVQTPSEAMNIQNPYGAFAVDMLLDPIGSPAIAKGLVKGLPAAAKYATTRTPLKNTWKLNPKAYQYNLPENTMWRGLGQEGMEDAVSSGLFRSKQNIIPEYYPGTKLRMNKSFGNNPYFTPKFKTAATYGDNYLAEVPRDAANWKQRYARTDWSQIADRPIPISEGRILQKDWLKGYKPVEIPSARQSFKSEISNLGEADRSITDLLDIFGIPDRVANIKSIGKELKGEIIKGSKNRKAIEEGNTWLKNWIADPITQNKIENDLVWASQRNDQYGLGYQQAKSFTPISKEYPFSQQLKDLFSGNPHIHSTNYGVSSFHKQDPYKRIMSETLNNPKMGSFISRIPSKSSAQRLSTTIHEGTHDWASDYLLRESGQADFIKDLYSDNLKKSMASGTYDYSPKAFHMEYLARPTEMHARIMQLRNLLKMTPEQSTMVTPEIAEDIIRKIEIPENAKFVDPKFLDVIDKDPKKLAALFNRLWVAPAATALGASQLQKKKNGGWLNKYK